MATRVLVMYGTVHGQAAKVAADMAVTLREEGATVVVSSTASPWVDRPEDYTAVVVVASVHAGHFQRTVRNWVRQHRTALATRPSVFVALCLAVLNRTPKVERDLRAIFDRFRQETEWEPTETKVVAGALKYTKYGWFTRWMMKRIVSKAGGDVDTSRDYEYTDWDDLRDFTRRFLREQGSYRAASLAGVSTEKVTG